MALLIIIASVLGIPTIYIVIMISHHIFGSTFTKLWVGTITAGLLAGICWFFVGLSTGASSGGIFGFFFLLFLIPLMVRLFWRRGND